MCPFNPFFSALSPSTLQAHERLEETKLEAVRDNNLELVQEILKDITRIAQQDSTAAELARILQEPHFQVGGESSWGEGGGENWGAERERIPEFLYALLICL